jgi:hypothetical protein
VKSLSGIRGEPGCDEPRRVLFGYVRNPIDCNFLLVLDLISFLSAGPSNLPAEFKPALVTTFVSNLLHRPFRASVTNPSSVHAPKSTLPMPQRNFSILELETRRSDAPLTRAGCGVDAAMLFESP